MLDFGSGSVDGEGTPTLECRIPPEAECRRKPGNGDVLRCSFCNKSQRDVKKLIAGPTVYICDECVDICLDIIAEDRVLETQAPETKLPKPKEIKGFLDELRHRPGTAKKRSAWPSTTTTSAS